MIRVAVALLEGPAASRRMQRRFPDCSACRLDPEDAKAWGCAGESDEPLYWTTCGACGGAGGAGCRGCNGTGTVEHRRCPTRVLEEGGAGTKALMSLVHACYQAAELGVLPAAGGWLDQSMPFAQACRIVGAERASWERDAQEFEDKERRSKA